MKNSVLVVAVMAILSVACSDSKETPSGYKYTLLRKGTGEVAKPGQILIMDFMFMDGKDSVWNDSRKNDFPTMVMAQDSVPEGDGVLEIFQLLTKGDSVTFQIPAKTLFEKTFRTMPPPGVDTTGMFTFHIGVTDIVSEEKAREIQSELVAKQNEKAMKLELEQLAKDTMLIANHLQQKSLVASTTPSGIKYIITKPGKGENARPGQSVRVNYTGYLLDGPCFDSSIESVARANNVFNEARKPYEPLEVMLGYQQVIPGWEEALGLMNAGSKMTVFIPSTLAYGTQGRGSLIVPNSILKFDMEMIEIK
ncbi:MAG: FKBP-type peptidyl-prolyl cis-trans isomerase [Cyclobacteriaceae bacterium]|nr:FKBP-type peptidyl-prolyl cis-trans isomerase [Cyclobacteriaceae bacterium]